jgi:hypothetical protein
MQDTHTWLQKHKYTQPLSSASVMTVQWLCSTSQDARSSATRTPSCSIRIRQQHGCMNSMTCSCWYHAKQFMAPRQCDHCAAGLLTTEWANRLRTPLRMFFKACMHTHRTLPFPHVRLLLGDGWQLKFSLQDSFDAMQAVCTCSGST